MIRSALFALSLLTCFAAPAAASGLTASQSVEVASISVDADGVATKTFQVTEEIAPGDELRYVLSYDNQGTDAASNVRLDMPVPASVNFVAGSVEAGPAIVTYSADNGASYAALDALSVSEDGATRPAQAEDITNIRWTFAEAITPGQSGTISYRAILQ